MYLANFGKLLNGSLVSRGPASEQEQDEGGGEREDEENEEGDEDEDEDEGGGGEKEGEWDEGGRETLLVVQRNRRASPLWLTRGRLSWASARRVRRPLPADQNLTVPPRARVAKGHAAPLANWLTNWPSRPGGPGQG